ncbi:fibronectin type III domain-containing protein [Saccharothrix saharensis]|uniref:fibronectin type III domain-containing protein n=1 Tax=Saccharothrix saharensis TaxID=571190 RepID=UPI0036C06D86
MKHRRPARGLTGLGAMATATAVVAGLVLGTGTGSAAQGDLTQTYSCPFPLIGDQTVTVDITTTQPGTVAAGRFTPKLDITAVSNAGPTATQGLRLVGAETIRGTARATSKVTAPGDQGVLTVQVATDVPNQPIPAVGNDLVLNAVGSAPGLRFDQPGTATVEVTDLVLEMTPLRADGTPTDLGTFVADCTPTPNQDTVLQTYAVTGSAVTPETPAGTGGTPPLRQVYTCPFPLIGNQNVTVDIDTDLPAEIGVGEFTPQIGISAVSNAGPTATQGLRLVGAETIQGTAVATSLVRSPGGHQAVAVPTTVPNQPIPVSGDLVINAAGTAPALRFDQPGTATLSVHDLVLTMTPKKADGSDTGLGTFVADCTPVDPAQRTVLHTFTVTPAQDTEAPATPTGLTAGETTPTSVALTWAAATDNVGVTGYDVYAGDTLVAGVEGTSTTVGGLAPDTEYSFTVVARDAAGNRSSASAAVTARTKAAPDTHAPTAPGNLVATGATPTSVTLEWAAASDNVGVTRYEVFNGGTLATTAQGTGATVDGLSPNTEYAFTVRAVDAAGNASGPSDPLTVRTPAAPDTEGPSTPANPRATGASASSIGLAWDASTDNVGVTGYEVYNGTTLATTVEGTTATVDGLAPDTEYSFTVVAKDAAGNRSAASPAVTARTETAPDTEGPAAPAGLAVSGVTQSSVTLGWTASTDNVGVTGYEVYNGTALAATVEGTTATVDGLAPDTEYSFTVVAKDAAGNRSAASPAVTARTEATPDTQAPTAPSVLRSTAQTENSVALAWDASTDNVGVTGYEVFNGGTSAATTTGTTATVTGLQPDTEYTFTVVAKDAAGNTSGASTGLKVRTKATQGPPVIRYGYGLTGNTKIKAANGTVALTGGIDAALDLSTGAFEADLTLNPTSGRFRAFGFVPVKAKIEFAQAARTTGTLAGGVLKSTSSVTVKLPHVSVLGIPVSTSADCRTRTPASIPLESEPGFDPLAGGTATGVYTLPALTGCGPLTGLISGLTSGPGNTIQVALAPRPRR